MKDFTIPAHGSRAEYLVITPVLLLAREVGAGAYTFVVTVLPEGHCLSLYTEDEFARQAIGRTRLADVVPFRLVEPASLRNVLRRALETSGATHAAIDTDPANPAAGCICPIDLLIGALPPG